MGGLTSLACVFVVGGVRRLDLWNVYVDKEIKAGHLDAARTLLDRMCTFKLSAKKMKVSAISSD